MPRMRSNWLPVTAMAMLAIAPTARAEGLLSYVFGFMDYFNVQISGSQDLLRDNIRVNVTGDYRNPFNSTFGFVLANMSLSGTMQMSTGPSLRGVPSSQFTFRTTNAATAPQTPLAYTIDFPLGTTQIDIDGNLLINISIEQDILGFYDATVQISNRGTLTTSTLLGPTTSRPIDQDIGPISLSGNIFLPPFNLFGQGIFDRLGLNTNPFARARNSQVASLTTVAEQLLLSAELDTSTAGGVAAAHVSQPIPEPTTLLLLIPAGMMLLRRKGR